MSSIGRTDSEYIYSYAFLCGFLCSLHCPTLVVFTVGNEEDGTRYILLLSEGARSKVYGCGNVCALCGNHGRVNAIEEHLCRNVVVGDGELHEGLSCIHHQSNLVVPHIVNHIAYEHLCLIQSRRTYIIGKHGVGNVHSYDGFNTIALRSVNLCTELRTCSSNYERGESQKEKPRLSL